MTDSVFVQCRGLVRIYSDGSQTIRGVDGIDLDLGRGQLIAVTGPSGSGKTTLLNLIGALDYPDAGEIVVNGTSVTGLSRNEQADFRANQIAVMLSRSNLLPVLTVYENISLSLSLLRLAEAEIDRRIVESLEATGIGDLAHRNPSRLSSGQLARAALARAVAMETPGLVADEPSAHLDSVTAGEIATLLAELARQRELCIVVATHDPAIAGAADREVRLVDGRIAE